jgi:hypothetical protein
VIVCVFYRGVVDSYTHKMASPSVDGDMELEASQSYSNSNNSSVASQGSARLLATPLISLLPSVFSPASASSSPNAKEDSSVVEESLDQAPLQELSVEEALDTIGFGHFQIRLVILCSIWLVFALFFKMRVSSLRLVQLGWRCYGDSFAFILDPCTEE